MITSLSNRAHYSSLNEAIYLNQASLGLTDTLIEAIDDTTAVVAVSYVQFSTGTRCDVDRLREATRNVGARLVSIMIQRGQ